MKYGIVFLVLLVTLTRSVFAAEVESPSGVNAWLSTNDAQLDRLGTPLLFDDGNFSLTFSGEFRYRLELRDNFNFNSSFEDDAVNLLRSRLGVDVKFKKHVRVFIQGQDSESFASQTVHRSSAFVNRLDLHQLFAEISSPWDTLPLSVQVGRQELSYGDQRFVGAFGWSNVARVFDAVKLVYKPSKRIKFDTFFSQVVPVNKGQMDTANHHENFWGMYLETKPTENHTFDTFLFIRHDRNNEIKGEYSYQRGQLKEYTLGNHFKGKKSNLDYGIEWAWQFGSRAHNLIEAWALHTELGYTFDLIPWSPRMRTEFNHGSGDDHKSDGRYGNFDNLFPTNHLHYGYMDFASLRNINNLKFGLEVKPNERVKLSADYHLFDSFIRFDF